jgi:hypothetical protein
VDAITAALDQLEVGMPIAAANLTMDPLLLSEESAPGYLTLDEALAAGLASVTEVSEAGSVPELLVKNLAKTPVLILDGEELVGAKQNRIVNLTILVAAQQTLHIPVSCVEAGRWARRSREFVSAGRAHYASGRARKLEQVSFAMRESGSRSADQGDVWAGIDAKACRLMGRCPAGCPRASGQAQRATDCEQSRRNDEWHRMLLSGDSKRTTKRLSVGTFHAKSDASNCASCVGNARPFIGRGGGGSVSHGIRTTRSASPATAHFEIRSASPALES